MEPWGAEEPEASKELAEPGGATVAVAVADGAWSGVTAMPCGLVPTAMGAPTAPVAVSMGVTFVLPTEPG